MYWLQVLWAVVRGLAAGISACYWDDFVASQQGKKKGPSPEQPGPFTGPVAPSEPAVGVRVDTGRKEGEFAAGVPYMGGAADPRLRPTQAAAPPREGESRRKRRSQPAAPTPAEQLCARCKSALGHELTTAVPADLAVTQEAADLPPSAPSPQAAARTEYTATSLATPPVEPTAPTSSASASKAPGEIKWERPPLLDRLVTRLSTRGALTRLVESAGAVPSGA